jgi:hypothetical protein
MNLFTYLGAALGLLVLVVMAAAPLLLALPERRRDPATPARPAPPLKAVHSS